MIVPNLQAHWDSIIYDGTLHQAATNLLEARHDVASDGADQGRNVIHETFWETVLSG